MVEYSSGKLVLVLAMVSAALGCTSITKDTVAPNASLASPQLVEMGIVEQRFRVGVLLENPSAHAITIRRANALLTISDTPFVSGVSSEGVVLPANGSAVVEFDATSPVGNILNNLGTILGAQTVNYHISGTLELDNILVAIPFSHRDEIALKDILR
jgi:LEA14-like dessication related protein